MGRLVDAVIGAMPWLMLYLTDGRLLFKEMHDHPGIEFYFYTGTLGQVGLGVDLGIIALQALLIATRGQSIGKLLVHTRIVRTGGAHAGFFHGWLIRTAVLGAVYIELPLWLDALGTWVATIVFVLDVLCIFLPGRRCLHDRLAGTEVLDVR